MEESEKRLLVKLQRTLLKVEVIVLGQEERLLALEHAERPPQPTVGEHRCPRCGWPIGTEPEERRPPKKKPQPKGPNV